MVFRNQFVEEQGQLVRILCFVDLNPCVIL
jgi:hypothetical protein